ncbi:MAG: putative transport system permease protein [Acidobacteriota bacterium]|nr:putative transport system permease protein [Acidobacteriota bacterium]
MQAEDTADGDAKTLKLPGTRSDSAEPHPTSSPQSTKTKPPSRRRSLAGSALWESFRVAISSLRANKLRAGLTLIGIIVGVSAVIAVVTIIKGLDQTVASTFSSQGSTVFSISKRPQIITSREDFLRFNKRKDVTDEDWDAIARLCTSCWRTGLTANVPRETVKHGDQKSDEVTIQAITISMFDINAVNLDAGRYFSDSEYAAGREAAVVGPDILENLFGGAPPDSVIGKDVRIAGHAFEIIGVAEKKGKIFGFSRDNLIYIPYTSFERIYGARKSLVVFIQAASAEQLTEVQDQVRAIMRNRRGRTFRDTDDGFALETQDVFLDLYGKATSNIYIVTIGVAAISLVVGGIVVMNIMLVSVTERTREIGIRKAVGARQTDILRQFLIEAVTVTSIGGAIGVLTGFGLAYLISMAMGFPLLLSINSALLGVGVSSLVGIISGLWPAWRAARLHPIDALRAE